MVQLLSNKGAGFFPRLTGFLRSSHALLGLLAILCFLFFLVAADFPLIIYGSFFIFCALALAVVYRFHRHGPEVDRQQPIITFSQTETSIFNIEPSSMDVDEFRELVMYVVKHRKELPLPTGVIEGRASDPKSIRVISREEAKRVAEEDKHLLLQDKEPGDKS